VRQDVAEEIVNHPDFKDVYDDIKESVEDAARDHQQVQILYSLIRANPYLDKKEVDALSTDLNKRFPGGGNDPPPPGPPHNRPGPPAPPNGPGGIDNTPSGGGGGKRAASETPADLTLKSAGSLLEEAKTVRKERAKRGGTLSEVIAKTVDVITDDVLKPLVIELVADPATKNQMDILLDDDVLYNFNDVISEKVENVLRASARKTCGRY
jgi:hypothetical protein